LDLKFGTSHDFNFRLVQSIQIR